MGGVWLDMVVYKKTHLRAYSNRLFTTADTRRNSL